MSIIGYVRTTITDGDPSEQAKKLKEYGCDKIFHEAYNGKAGDYLSDSLEAVIVQLQAGDTLVATELSRLGKTTRQLADFTSFLKKRRLHLVCLADKIDTREPMGAAYFNLMDGLAKMECTLIKERTLIGLSNARKKGKIGGRPKIDPKTVTKIRQLYFEKKETIQLISSKCGVSVGTCYKYINLPEDEFTKILSR